MAGSGGNGSRPSVVESVEGLLLLILLLVLIMLQVSVENDRRGFVNSI